MAFPVLAKRVSIGHRPLEHEYYDKAPEWTVVNQQAFPTPGTVEVIEMFICKVSKGLRMGVFRPEAGKKCAYRLVYQLDLMDTIHKVGFKKVILKHYLQDLKTNS